MPYFDDLQTAISYEHARPFFHPVVIERIRSFLKLGDRIECALDVGCGTGQSARALRELAIHVVGVDRSQSMLRAAPRASGLAFVASCAEQLPFAAHSVDLVSVSLAFHWFEQDRFLREAHRVLRAGGWLVIYNNGFLGTMSENPDFQRWNRDVYFPRYPVPPRNASAPIEEQCAAFELTYTGQEHFEHVAQFSPTELAAYLCTQSNVRAVVESGHETDADAYAWICDSVTPLFPAARGTFSFAGAISYLTNMAGPSSRAL